MNNKMFETFKLKGKTIKNRLVVPAMVTNYCTVDGKATNKYLAYHEERAKGGFGLIITEDYVVNPSGRGFVNVAGLWDDSQIESHSKLPELVKKHGATILAQIYHCGRQSSKAVTGMDLLAPSPIQCAFSPDIPKELTQEEIKGLIEDFGDTALRVQKCGFDGVEVHGGHGYLIAQFMSLYANKRVDNYGGSLENRLRFPTEIVKNIRKKCGDDFIIGFRISADEFIDGGRTIEETKVMVSILEQTGIDIIHVSAGVYATADTIIPPAYTKYAWIANLAKEVKSITKLPVITVGRINDPQIANSVLESGCADFISLGRASLTDPHFPNKAKEGRFDEIKQCIACNRGCIGELFMNHQITCVLNPLVGMEKEREIKKTDNPKKVAVIGAGPAGLQAAIVAKTAGHDVVVYEKTSYAGGNFRLAAIPPAKGEIANFTVWQLNQLKKLNTEVKYNIEVTPEFMEKNPVDVIIVATGAKPIVPPIEGANLPHVVTANDVLEGKVNVGYVNVVIGGGSVGAETANHLAVNLKQVSIVEMTSHIAADEALAPKWHLLKALEKRDVKMLTNAKVTKITSEHVILSDNTKIPASTVVLATGYVSDNTLYNGLSKKGHDVRLIGDANAVAAVMEAVAQGHDAGLKI